MTDGERLFFTKKYNVGTGNDGGHGEAFASVGEQTACDKIVEFNVDDVAQKAALAGIDGTAEKNFGAIFWEDGPKPCKTDGVADMFDSGNADGKIDGTAGGGGRGVGTKQVFNCAGFERNADAAANAARSFSDEDIFFDDIAKKHNDLL